MSLSYHPLHLVDMFVYAVVVHRGLALPICLVPLRHGSEPVERPVAAELVPGFWRHNQPTDLPLKVLLLGQIDSLDLARLQHLCAKKNYIWMSKSKINNFKVIVEDGK
jgi:hypothetical protein